MQKFRLQKELFLAIIHLNLAHKKEVTEIGSKKPCTIGPPRRCGGNELLDYQGIATFPESLPLLFLVLIVEMNSSTIRGLLHWWFISRLTRFFVVEINSPSIRGLSA